MDHTPSQDHVARLFVRSPGVPPAFYDLAPGVYVIGRSQNCQIVTDDPTVGRQHARITVKHDGDIVAEDLDSANGTFLRGHRLSKAYALPGDQMEIGDTLVTFLDAEEEVTEDGPTSVAAAHPVEGPAMDPLDVHVNIEGPTEEVAPKPEPPTSPAPEPPRQVPAASIEVATPKAKKAGVSLSWGRFRQLVGLALLVAFATGLALVSGAILALSEGYYLTAPSVRADHEFYALLRPGGVIGLSLGIVGTALMLMMLLYTVRKWFPRATWMGTPAWWLRFHIVCGLMGPAFIAMHGGLTLPSGLIAVGFWCMVLVMLSGFFGRYVFGHFPKTARGREFDYGKALEALADVREQLVAATADSRSELVGQAVAQARDFDGRATTLFGLMRIDFEMRRRGRQVESLTREAGLEKRTRKTAVRMLKNQLRLKRNLEAWEVSRRLFRYWHLFHAPLAQAMYIIAVVHVFNAILFAGSLDVLKNAGLLGF